MIKMIASDLDGTILLNGAQEIPEELFGLIRELKELGIFFVAASGRQYSNMYRNFLPVAEDIGFVCENGAIAYQKRELLYEKSFDRMLADEIVADILKREDTEFLYSTREFYYIKPRTEEYYRFLKDVVKTDFQVVDSLDEMVLPCIKMACYEQNDATKEKADYWTRKYAGKCKVATAGGKWVDFIPFGVNKAVGIRTFMEKMNIRPQECMTFGDEFNDVEMLQCTPYGFAMAHAREGVKEQAPYIAENVLEMIKEIIKAKGNIEEVLKNVQ